MRDFRIALLTGALTLSGCATTTETSFPSYDYQGIDLLASASGYLKLDDGCYRLEATSPPNSSFVLILPRGTTLTNGEITIPASNGGTTLSPGDFVELQGGFESLDDPAPFISNPTECAGSAFLVNRAGKLEREE